MPSDNLTSHSLTVANVSKTYPSGLDALAPTTFSLYPSEFVSLVGPSGCGKSTMLRLIAGLVEPTTGKACLGSGTTKIGFVFQDPTLMPWATVSENIQLPLKLSKTLEQAPKDDVGTVLDLVGLMDFRDAYPRELSGGMKMRASIARALIIQPDLLLLDEPFAALDEFTRAQLNEDLLHLWQQEKWTSIFVTHSIREAVFLSNRVLVMSPRPGRIIADVPVRFDHPRDPGLRHSHAYNDLCADIASLLAVNMNGEER